jgi:hypothetical protein
MKMKHGERKMTTKHGANVLRGVASVAFVAMTLLITSPVFAQSQQQISKCSRISFTTPRIAQEITGNPNSDPWQVYSLLLAQAQSPETGVGKIARGILQAMLIRLLDNIVIAA